MGVSRKGPWLPPGVKTAPPELQTLMSDSTAHLTPEQRTYRVVRLPGVSPLPSVTGPVTEPLPQELPAEPAKELD
ncbi:MAG: hypothetical protein ACRC7O_00580 [Fimbriiglobus sp.]